MGVGLHQGSALNLFLFAIIMGKLTEDISEEAPLGTLFAGDIMLSREDRRELEEALERLRNALEKHSLKISRTKTEYLKAGEDLDEEVRLQGKIVIKVEHFKYLGSMIIADASCAEEEAKGIQAGWMGWRGISGVLCE